jgi:hypothetical protein
MPAPQNPLKIYQLKVTLAETEPAIWRRILIPSTVTLHRLNLILQNVMGWTNSHLYMFVIGAIEYGEPDTDNEFNKLPCVDSRKAKLGQVVKTKGSTFAYEYDFGDTWIHELVVEDIMEPISGFRYPVCIEGKRACPPEDCGGPDGYSRLLGIIVNPEHKEYSELMTWLGGQFQPASFSVKEANRHLKPAQLP